MNKITLYVIDARRIDIDDLEMSKYLSENDFLMLEKYKIESVRTEKLISLYFKRKYIGVYTHNEYGKPIAKNKEFNISHSRGVVVLAISSSSPVGVDVEVIREHKNEVARYIANDEEYSYITNSEKFFDIWTSKESLVKCLGTGFKSSVSDIPALPLEGKKRFQGQSFFSKVIKKDDYVISITINSDESFEVIIQ